MDTPVWYDQIFTFLHDLDSTLCYLLIFGCTIAGWRILYGLYRLYLWARVYAAFFILKRLVYPHLFPYLPFVGKVTIFQALVGILYIVVNILLITIGTGLNADVVGTRAATLSAIYLIPLFCGPRLLLMMKMLGISLDLQTGLHKWFGRAAIAQVLLHTIISVVHNQPIQWTDVNISGIVGSSAFGFIFIFSFYIIRRVLYEWFLRSHLLLSVVALIAIWRHVPSKKPIGSVLIQISVYLYSIMAVLHWGYFAFRNLALGKQLARAEIVRLREPKKAEEDDELPPHVLLVTISVPREWRVKAGQYIYLSIPRVGVFSGIQSHPFMIVWWDHDVKGLTISLLMKPRHGFTSSLASSNSTSQLAFIDGPYGQRYNFGDYGTVVMFATGIGIAGQLPFVKELVSGYNNCKVRTHRIVLIWQMDFEYQENWIKPWMDKIIVQDSGYIVQTYLYVVRASTSKGAKIGDKIPLSKYGRLEKTFGPAPVSRLLQKEFGERKGRMIVSADEMSEEVRNSVQKHMDKDVRLVELDFQPSSHHRWRQPTLDLELGCRGLP